MASNGKLSLDKLNDTMQEGFNNIANDINELKNHIIKNLIKSYNKKLNLLRTNFMKKHINKNANLKQTINIREEITSR